MASWLPALQRLRNRVLFGPLPPARWLAQGLLRKRLRQMAGGFDAAFYLDQIPYAVQRRMAARAPALHYLLVGARLGRLPGPLFDLPRAREAHPGVPPARLLATAMTSPCPPLLPAAALPSRDPRPGVLLLDHARGGGSSQFLDLLAERLDHEGERVIRSLRLDGPEPRFSVRHDEGTAIVGLDHDLAPLLRRLGIARLLVNHVIDLPLATVEGLPVLARDLGLPYDVFLHDYLAACPRVNLIDSSGRYCGLRSTSACQPCVDPLGIAMPRWRAASAALLHGARRVTVPSRDLAVRIARVFGELPLDIWAPEREPEVPAAPTPNALEGPLHIATIGAINRPKGLDVLLALAQAAQRRDAPVRFTVMGYSSDNAALRRAGVTITGRYRNAAARELLARLTPDLVLFPAIWPETWSFTLTHALATGMDIAAFDIGAIADRLRARSGATLLPHALADRPDELLDRLIEQAQAHRLRQQRHAAPIPPLAPMAAPLW